MSIVVIHNPGAGGGERREAVARLAGRIEGAEVRESAAIDELAAIIDDCVASSATVVAAGGDGTIGAVVETLGDRCGAVTLGILPCGTGNDFARGLGIPLDLDAAVDVLRAGHVRPCDLVETVDADGRVRRFLNVAVGAFDDAQMAEIETKFKGSAGIFGYLAAAEEALRTRMAFALTVETAEGTRLEVDAVACVAANGPSMSAGIPVAPDAALDDGRLDLMIVESADTVGLAALAPLISAGVHVNAPGIRFVASSRIAIASDPPLPLRVDDEIAASPRWELTVLPRAVRVIAPAPDRESSS